MVNLAIPLSRLFCCVIKTMAACMKTDERTTFKICDASGDNASDDAGEGADNFSTKAELRARNQRFMIAD